MFMEWKRRVPQKGFLRFDNVFHCLLYEEIAKTDNKLNCHDGILSYLQDSTANPAHLAVLFLPCLGLPSKSHRENSISSIFLESPHQVDMKTLSNVRNTFLAISML